MPHAFFNVNIHVYAADLEYKSYHKILNISTEFYSLKSHVNFRTEISSGQSEERTTFFTCEKNRSSNQKPPTIFFHYIG